MTNCDFNCSDVKMEKYFQKSIPKKDKMKLFLHYRRKALFLKVKRKACATELSSSHQLTLSYTLLHQPVQGGHGFFSS